MKKRMAIMLIFCLILFGGIVGFYFFKTTMMKKYLANMKPPASTVTATTAKAETWSPYLQAVGTLQAKQNIEVVPEIGGKVVAIHFKSGQMVKKGDPLVDLNSENQQAQLNADIATLHLDKITYMRDKALYKRRAISRSDVDSALAKMQAQSAIVDSDKATLDKLHVVAPFDGRLGIREVNLGEYIAPPPSSGNIVPLSTVDPMLLHFNLPQQDMPKLKIGQALELTVDAFPGKTFTGTITATDADVSQDSRTILVQADVQNPDHQLVPGMFANVRVMLPKQPKVITVPQTAIVYSLYGNAVYVVKKDKTVEQRFVTIGQTRGIDIAIEKGLKAGETVVTSGQLKLHNGSSVVVNNSVKPD